MKLELYYYEQCPFCVRVLNTIKSLDLINHITLKNTLKSAEAREFHLNQTGKSTVPCLYIDGNPMFESNDICDWFEKNKSNLTPA